MKYEPFFVGSFDLTIDPKNRLSIPSAARDELWDLSRHWAAAGVDSGNSERKGEGAESRAETLFVLPGDRREVLAIYEAGFFKASKLGLPPTQQLSRHVRDWTRLELGLAAKVQPDAQGRIVIPDRLMKLVNMTRDITLVGAQDHYQIWSRAAYAAFIESKFANYDEGYEKTLEELAPYRKPVQVNH